MGILHGVPLSVSETSVEFLLQMGEFFQCKRVLSRCEMKEWKPMQGTTPWSIRSAFGVALTYTLCSSTLWRS
ncbi:hypothetical protein L596_005001 [Steinernema carpocapsae]|uniref:Uncharacterized protein n=1 Tax=Steinernema carpocapsae TaxID=34508 RepID=A0A4U8UXV0_STECR|nr:hypothetical protein L596_005001 [Steinernema carpocapsae]